MIGEQKKLEVLNEGRNEGLVLAADAEKTEEKTCI